MSFGQYVDDLAKRGIIDGNIAALLVAKHRAEVSNPLKPVRDSVAPILDEMYHASNGTTLEHLDAAKLAIRQFADRIDDELTELESHGRADK